MAIYGISGASCPAEFPFAGEINGAAFANPGCPPLLLAAIAWRETLCVMSPQTAVSFISDDNGHGVFQLTSSWPDDWQDVRSSASYAWQHFLLPAMNYWHGLENFYGDTLIKLCAATYNSGRSNARLGHENGNVDQYTTNNYGAGVLSIFQSLCATGKPS